MVVSGHSVEELFGLVGRSPFPAAKMSVSLNPGLLGEREAALEAMPDPRVVQASLLLLLGLLALGVPAWV